MAGHGNVSNFTPENHPGMGRIIRSFQIGTEEAKEAQKSSRESFKKSAASDRHLSLVKSPAVVLDWASPACKEVSDSVTCQTSDLFDLLVSVLRNKSLLDSELVARRLKEFFQPTKADVYRYVEKSYCTSLQAEVGFLNEEASKVLDLLLDWLKKDV